MKYRIPDKTELTKGRKGIRKHFVLRFDIDKLVADYAKRLDVSQAKVMEEMMLVGITQFEINHGFKVKDSNCVDKREESTGSLSEQLNEKFRLLIEQKRKNASNRANDIETAYSRRIVSDNEGFEAV